MGITGGLVRSVFSKSHSIRSHDTNYAKNNIMEKKRWKRVVRAYFCGDDLLFNSVCEDTTSVRSSEGSVTQHVPRGNGWTDSGEDFSSDLATQQHDSSDQEFSHCTNSEFLGEDVAAVIIQAAFRGFMVRRLRTREFTGVKNDVLTGFDSPSRESLGTSIEVQTGNSIGVVSIQEECLSSCTIKLQEKPKCSLFRQKDDWDDSIVNSSVAKMRYQNRLEAMTRCERALAYAFSQQLRICTKKKETISDSTEPNTSWSWLERWMATRQHELPVEDRISKQLNEPVVRKKFLNLSFEEKESCGSNEVPLQVNSLVNSKAVDKDGFKSPSSVNRLKSPRNISRRKTFPTVYYRKHLTKVNKRNGSREAENDRRQTVKQSGSTTSVCVYQDDASELSADHSVAA